MSKFTLSFFLFLSFATYSQSSKLIQGKVNYQGSYQKNIDVINFTTKKTTQTNTSGEFQIEAKINDVLVLMSENFADQKYKLTLEDFEKDILKINLTEKPIALEEVEIEHVEPIKRLTVSYEDIKTVQINKDAERPKNKDIYTGEIVNAMDFIEIGKMIGKLFKNKKPKTKIEPTVTFKEYALTNFNETFFITTLKLKPDETSRFLEYCQADPNSKLVIETNDELAILEFLMKKKIDFDKL